MNQKIIFYIIIQLFASICFSQHEANPVNRLSLLIGVSNESLKDKVFSDLKFQGIVFNGEVGFEKISDASIWSSSVSAKYGIINHNELFESTYINFNVNLKYLIKVSTSRFGGFYIGPSLSSRMNILDYDGYENGSWMTGHSLDLAMRKIIHISNLDLETQFLLPLVGLLSRPPYAGRDEFVFSNTDNIPKIIFSRNQFYTVNKFFNPQASIACQFKTGKFDLSSRLKYEYLLLDSIHSYQRNSVSLSFIIGLNLKKNKE